MFIFYIYTIELSKVGEPSLGLWDDLEGGMGEEREGMYITTDLHCRMAETSVTLCINYPPAKGKCVK